MTDLTVYNGFVSKAEDRKGDYFRKNLGSQNFLVLGETKKIETDYFFSNEGSYSFKYTSLGKEYYQFANKLIATSSDRYLLTNPNSRYRSYINEEKNVNTTYVFFSNQEIRKLYTSLVRSENVLLEDPFGEPEDLVFQETLYNISPELKVLLNHLSQLTFSPGFESEINKYMYSLMEYLLLSNQEIRIKYHKIDATKKSTKKEIYRRLLIAKDYIDSCYEENISVSDLAQMTCMCDHHFLRRFKSFFKITPYQYLSNRRIEIAKEYLLDKAVSVNEIALKVGFENVSSFNRSFKKNVKMPPTHYRLSNSSF